MTPTHDDQRRFWIIPTMAVVSIALGLLNILNGYVLFPGIPALALGAWFAWGTWKFWP